MATSSELDPRWGGGTPLSRDLTERLHAAQSQEPTAINSTQGPLKVHADQSSTAIARSLGAQAFTFQDEIYFNRAHFQPATEQGRQVIGHEAAHILSQRRFHSDATASPHIHRKLDLSGPAGDLTHLVYGDASAKGSKPSLTESKTLREQWAAGLEKYLGLTYKADGTVEDAPYQPPSDPKLLAVWKANITFIEGIRTEVKGKINARISNATVELSPGFLASEKTSNIQFNPDKYRVMAVTESARWDGFWILLHEILHTISRSKYDDPYVKSNGVEITKADRLAGIYEKQTRQFQWRGGGTEQREMTTAGTAEEALNRIRESYGLPTRETYSDPIGISPTDPYTSVFRQKTSDGYEDFYGFVMPDPTTSQEERTKAYHQLGTNPFRGDARAKERLQKEATEQQRRDDLNREWAKLLRHADYFEADGKKYKLKLFAADDELFGRISDKKGLGTWMGIAVNIEQPLGALRPDRGVLQVDLPAFEGQHDSYAFVVENSELNKIRQGGEVILSSKQHKEGRLPPKLYFPKKKR